MGYIVSERRQSRDQRVRTIVVDENLLWSLSIAIISNSPTQKEQKYENYENLTLQKGGGEEENSASASACRFLRCRAKD